MWSPSSNITPTVLHLISDYKCYFLPPEIPQNFTYVMHYKFYISIHAYVKTSLYQSPLSVLSSLSLKLVTFSFFISTGLPFSLTEPSAKASTLFSLSDHLPPSAQLPEQYYLHFKSCLEPTENLRIPLGHLTLKLKSPWVPPQEGQECDMTPISPE